MIPVAIPKASETVQSQDENSDLRKIKVRLNLRVSWRRIGVVDMGCLV